jgi:hypothetical protein
MSEGMNRMKQIRFLPSYIPGFLLKRTADPSFSSRTDREPVKENGGPP